MGSPTLLLITLSLISALAITSTTAQSTTFKCSNTGTGTCQAIIDYVSPNTTTISNIKTLFGVKHLRDILGVNSLPLSTLPNYTVLVNRTIIIPFKCLCSNGTGQSNKYPVYTVQKEDGLYHIAAEVFSRLVTYQQIALVNNITDVNLIEIGQKLWIPLPCSCDEVDDAKVVHYGHVVKAGSSVEQIAQDYGTTQDTLLRLNSLADPKDLQAGSVLDVPLKACTSMVNDSSQDYPLLVSNGTYVVTANNCVKCTCDSAANNWTLQCEPSQLSSSTCPTMQCELGTSNLILGNTSSTACNRTTCAYAGYTNNQTILTTLAMDSTCPAENNAPKIGLQGSSWSFLLITIQLVLFCLPLFR